MNHKATDLMPVQPPFLRLNKNARTSPIVRAKAVKGSYVPHIGLRHPAEAAGSFGRHRDRSLIWKGQGH